MNDSLTVVWIDVSKALSSFPPIISRLVCSSVSKEEGGNTLVK